MKEASVFSATEPLMKTNLLMELMVPMRMITTLSAATTVKAGFTPPAMELTRPNSPKSKTSPTSAQFAAVNNKKMGKKSSEEEEIDKFGL